MTPAVVSMGLLKVHLMVAVEGHLFQKWFHASPNLAYTYIWDKTDAYGQRVYGLSEAVGKWKGWMEEKLCWRAQIFFFSPSLAHPEYIRHFTTKTALVMTEGVGLISEPEGEIIHQKPSLDPLRNMAPVKGSFFFFICLFFIEAAFGSVSQP